VILKGAGEEAELLTMFCGMDNFENKERVEDSDSDIF